MSQARFNKSDRWIILLFGLTYMFNYIDRTIISVLAEAIRNDLRLGDLEIGLLGGLAFSVFYAVMGVPIARLAERRSRVKIIAVVTALWSFMTMLSGAVGSFWQLLLCRMGVGVGEAGFTPALVSYVSDRFSAARAAAAYSLIALGTMAGGATAAIVGGWIAANYGWRIAFVAVGFPGLLLAALIWLTIPEPQRTGHAVDESPPPFLKVVRHLLRSPAFLLLTGGSASVNVVGFGLTLFLIPLLVRVHGFDLAQAGFAFAVCFSLGSALGTLTGGLSAAYLGERDARWFAWAPAALLCLGLPAYLAAIYQDDWRVLLGLMFVASFTLVAFLPTIMTTTQRLVDSRMRASTAALHTFGVIALGLGTGATLLGYLSDRFAAAQYGANYESCLKVAAESQSAACSAASAAGLQDAMFAVGGFLLLSIVLFALAGRTLVNELKDR